MTAVTDWERLADYGDTVSAIKACRAGTGVGLSEAKAVVERWLSVYRPPSVAYQVACRTAGRVLCTLDRYFASTGRDYQYCIQALATRELVYVSDSPLIAWRGQIAADDDGRCELVVYIELEEVPAGRERAVARAALAGGAKLVWVLQPDVTGVRVESAGGDQVHLLYEDALLDGGDVLPGFSCPVADLFA